MSDSFRYRERMSAGGRLPRLPLFAQSGSWQISRLPQMTAFRLDRESEQPAYSVEKQLKT